jgi:hypothetical protein
MVLCLLLRHGQDAGGAIAFSEAMELGAIASTNTVTATLTHWFLSEERVVFVLTQRVRFTRTTKRMFFITVFLLWGVQEQDSIS